MQDQITFVPKFVKDFQWCGRRPICFRLDFLYFDLPLPLFFLPPAAGDLMIDVDVLSEVAAIDDFVKVLSNVGIEC